MIGCLLVIWLLEHLHDIHTYLLTLLLISNRQADLVGRPGIASLASYYFALRVNLRLSYNFSHIQPLHGSNTWFAEVNGVCPIEIHGKGLLQNRAFSFIWPKWGYTTTCMSWSVILTYWLEEASVRARADEEREGDLIDYMMDRP